MIVHRGIVQYSTSRVEKSRVQQSATHLTNHPGTIGNRDCPDTFFCEGKSLKTMCSPTETV